MFYSSTHLGHACTLYGRLKLNYFRLSFSLKKLLQSWELKMYPTQEAFYGRRELQKPLYNTLRSFIQPMPLNVTMHFGLNFLYNSADYCLTPAKTMNGYSFEPSAFAPRQTLMQTFSWQVVLSITSFWPVLFTVLLITISDQTGVSSIVMILKGLNCDGSFWAAVVQCL